MKIGLIDVDGHKDRKTGIQFPNIALMKVATYYKQLGHEVEHAKEGHFIKYNTMSSKLEIAMNEAYKQAGENAYFGTGFKMGAEYMKKEIEDKNRWISETDEEKPVYCAPILLKFYNGTYMVGYYLRHKHRKDMFYSYTEPDVEFVLEAVKEWRYFL